MSEDDVKPTAAQVAEAIEKWGRDDPRTEAITRERMASLLVAESANDTEWWWLSFVDTEADPHQFLGLVLVRANGMMSAVSMTGLLGINPGGQVAGWPLPPAAGDPPERYQNKLLDKSIATFLSEHDWTDHECTDCHPDYHEQGVHAPVSDGPK